MRYVPLFEVHELTENVSLDKFIKEIRKDVVLWPMFQYEMVSQETFRNVIHRMDNEQRHRLIGIFDNMESHKVYIVRYNQVYHDHALNKMIPGKFIRPEKLDKPTGSVYFIRAMHSDRHGITTGGLVIVRVWRDERGIYMKCKKDRYIPTKMLINRGLISKMYLKKV